jgi:hypothetical protein
MQSSWNWQSRTRSLCVSPVTCLRKKAKKEIEDFAKWVKPTKPGDGDEFLRVNGAGEMLVFSAADFEDFLEPRPYLPDTLEVELEAVVKLLVANRWPFRRPRRNSRKMLHGPVDHFPS